jgi:hypothetical protein
VATPSQREVDLITDVLCHARAGGTTLPRLVEAHELAERYHMAAVLSELRSHIRAHVPDPSNGKVAVGRSLVIGVLAGLLTNALMRTSS